MEAFFLVLFLHVLSGVWLLLMVGLGLTRQFAKSANRYLILSRLGYLAFIITGVYLSTRSLTTATGLTILKAGCSLVTIGLIELAFARQQDSHLTPKLITLLVSGIVLTLLVSGVLYLVTNI